ncbi:hypothetical protein SAMN05444161_7548 [Rhizobiales bacterium GAS191]|nr:hypothetical protein SAMN05444161_7548 [Rhizobiales bacterium GAS191]
MTSLMMKTWIASSPSRARGTARTPVKAGTLGRRLIAGAVLGTAAWLATGIAEARPHQPPTRQALTRQALARHAGGISVDIRPLLALGLDGYAQVLGADLESALEAEFAGHLAPGTRLLVQLRGVSLNSYVGGYAHGFGNNDYLDGIVTLIGPNGQELATQKILAVSPADSGGAWYTQGAERRRTAYLSTVFASWARRYTSG